MNWDLIKSGKIKLKHSDFISIHSKYAFMSKVQRFFTKRLNETKTFANHNAGISGMKIFNGEYSYDIIEAVYKIIETDLYKYAKPDYDVVICRYRKLTDKERLEISIDCRNRFKGKKYNFIKIGLQGIDRLISKFSKEEFNFFSRLSIGCGEICTVTWTDPYSKKGVLFGDHAQVMDPDQVLDYMLLNIKLWKVIFMTNGAETFLNEITPCIAGANLALS